MTQHESAVAVLRAYRSSDGDQRSVREAMLAFLAARPDACSRSCEPGHLTASALVVDPSRGAALLTLHRRIGLWLQLGGHCEPADAGLVEAASREAREESGIADLRIDPEPISLGVHPLTCSLGVPTRHLDVRFLVTAPAGAEPAISPESLDLQWFPFDHLPEPHGYDLHSLVRAARDRLSANRFAPT